MVYSQSYEESHEEASNIELQSVASHLQQLCVQQESEPRLNPVAAFLVQLSQVVDIPEEGGGEMSCKQVATLCSVLDALPMTANKKYIHNARRNKRTTYLMYISSRPISL